MKEKRRKERRKKQERKKKEIRKKERKKNERKKEKKEKKKTDKNGEQPRDAAERWAVKQPTQVGRVGCIEVLRLLTANCVRCNETYV